MSRADKPQGARLVGEDPNPHATEWRLERWGWALMTLVVLLAVLGFWGSGVLSATTTTSADGRLSVSYDLFARDVGQSSIIVQTSPGTSRGGNIQISVDQRCLSSYQVQSIHPEPSATALIGERLLYEFPASADSALTLRLDLRPSGGMGLRECTFGLGALPQVRISQWVHP